MKIQDKMHFECLPNELLLIIFEYIDAIHIFRSFYDLNTRFHQLLCTKFRSYRLDLRSISKHDFQIICQQHLPFITDRVNSLYLSDNEETPNLPKIFLSRWFYNQSIHSFTIIFTLLHSIIRTIESTNRSMQTSYISNTS